MSNGGRAGTGKPSFTPLPLTHAQGWQLILQGCFQPALSHFRAAIQKNPNDEEALVGLIGALGHVNPSEIRRYADRSVSPRYKKAFGDNIMVGLVRGGDSTLWNQLHRESIARENEKTEREIIVDDYGLAMTRPYWTGEPLAGKVILIADSIGIGDTFGFLRYAHLLAALPQPPRQVVSIIRPSLIPIVKENLSGLRIDAILNEGNEGEGWPEESGYIGYAADYITTLVYLQSVLNMPFSFAPVPYLRANAADVSRWGKRLGEFTPKRGHLWVGVVWASGAFQRRPIDNEEWSLLRDAKALDFAPLGGISGVRLFSLQKGPGQDSYTQIPGCVSLSGEIRCWTDTAAILANLDLLISVDTSVPHLSGAMGVPTWTLLHATSCKFWGLSETTPRYPTMRLYRQKRMGEWRSVIQRVARDLRCLVGNSAKSKR